MNKFDFESPDPLGDPRLEQLTDILRNRPFIDQFLNDWGRKIREEVERVTGIKIEEHMFPVKETVAMSCDEANLNWKMYAKMIAAGAPTLIGSNMLLDNIFGLNNDFVSIIISIVAGALAAYAMIRRDISGMVDHSLEKQWLATHFSYDVTDKSNPRPVFQTILPPKKEKE